MPHGIKAWSLLSRHGQALVILARNPKLRIADLAKMLSVSERSVRLLLSSLHRSKILRVEKQGRANRYEIDYSYVLPHMMERSIPLKAIVELADVPSFATASPVEPPPC